MGASSSTVGRNLPVAIAVGVGLAALFFVTLFAHPYAFLSFVALLVVVALLELDRAFRAHGLRPATLVALAAGLVAFFGAYTSGASGQSLGLVLLVLGALVWALFERDREQVAASLGATFLMVLWVPFLASFIGRLLVRPEGVWYVIVVIALAVTNDIAAYAWGIRFGAHKMAPTVSPGKTWEGFAGGVATTLAVAALVTTRVVAGLDVAAALVLGAGIAAAATVGDLAESLVKRDLGLKDLGTVLPGHGGVMDRVDGIIFALPAAHLLLIALGR